jgi:hypothetical protein
MKKLLLLGTMLIWGGAAAAEDRDQCLSSSLPAIQQTDVVTVERNGDSGSAVIQLHVAASLPGDGALTYDFSSADGTIAGDGALATWTVAGAGPFSADVEVSSPEGCKTRAHFTYHMEQTASQSSE